MDLSVISGCALFTRAPDCTGTRTPVQMSVISGCALFTRAPDFAGTRTPVQMGAMGTATTRRQTGRLLSGGDGARAPIWGRGAAMDQCIRV